MAQHRSLFMLLLLAAASAAVAQTPTNMPAMPVEPSSVPEVTMPVIAPSVTAPAAPATALPEVNVPSVAAPTAAPTAASQPALPALDPAPTQEPAIPVVDTPFTASDGADFSFGTADYSLLYTSTQINRMKSVLSILETARRNNTSTAIEVVEESNQDIDQIAPVVVEEPEVYPVYTLKSIAFRNNRDWTVWIGDLRITPTKNEQEVRVIGITPNLVQFLWKPAYREALQQRVAAKKLADSASVKHKRTTTNTAIYDAKNGQASFTLRPNQTFAPAYMATFEGKVVAPAMEKLSDDEAMIEEEMISAPAATGTQPSVAAGAADTSATNPVNLDALLRAQQTPLSGQPNSSPPASVPAPASGPIN